MSPPNNPFNNPFNNPYPPFLGPQNSFTSLGGEKLFANPTSVSPADLSRFTSPERRFEHLHKSLTQGNPCDGAYQVGKKFGETVGTCGYDPAKGPVFSIGHGSKDLKVKYREAPDHSAVFVERKVETPLGTGYCEGGGKYSNGVIGFFLNLAFR